MAGWTTECVRHGGRYGCGHRRIRWHSKASRGLDDVNVLFCDGEFEGSCRLTCGFVANNKGQRFGSLSSWRFESIAGGGEECVERCPRHSLLPLYELQVRCGDGAGVSVS